MSNSLFLQDMFKHDATSVSAVAASVADIAVGVDAGVAGIAASVAGVDDVAAGAVSVADNASVSVVAVVDEPSPAAQPVAAIAMDAVEITSDNNEQQSSMAQSVTATVSDGLLASTLDDYENQN